MIRVAFALALALAGAGTVGAEAPSTNFYAHGQRVAISPPLTITAPGSVTWTVRMPEFALPGTPYVKNCALTGAWDGSEPPEDEQLTLYAVRTNYTTGTYRLVFGDRSASGRAYQVCLRFPYLTMPGLYRALEAYEEE